jgi:hypothetical protein
MTISDSKVKNHGTNYRTLLLRPSTRETDASSPLPPNLPVNHSLSSPACKPHRGLHHPLSVENALHTCTLTARNASNQRCCLYAVQHSRHAAPAQVSGRAGQKPRQPHYRSLPQAAGYLQWAMYIHSWPGTARSVGRAAGSERAAGHLL